MLIDLKHLLIEAKQNLPPFLLALESESENLAQYGGLCCVFACCIYVFIEAVILFIAREMLSYILIELWQLSELERVNIFIFQNTKVAHIAVNWVIE